MSSTDAITQSQAHAIVEAVSAVPGVVELTRGTYGHVALLFPGERVAGLRIVRGLADATGLEVHAIVDLSVLGEETDLHVFSRRIRAAASGHTDLPVTVVIADAVYSYPVPIVTSSRSTP